MKHALAAIAIPFAIAGCGGEDQAPVTNRTIEVSGAWVEASVEGRDHTPAYMHIRTDTPDVLLDANVSGDVAEHTLLFAAHGGGDPARYVVYRPQPHEDGRMFARDTKDATFVRPGKIEEGRLVPTPAEGGPVGSEVDEIEVRVGSRYFPKGGIPMWPGGSHLMLTGLPEPLRPGQPVEIDLEFERAGAITVDAEVREARPGFRPRPEPPS